MADTTMEQNFKKKITAIINEQRNATGQSINEMQSDLDNESKKIDKNANKFPKHYLSNFINDKASVNPKQAYLLARCFQMPEDADLYVLYIMETHPSPINKFMADGYIQGMEKHYKDRWKAVLNKMNTKSKTFYGFKMKTGEVFEIKHGDLLSDTPYLIETDIDKKTQSPCTEADFIAGMKKGDRTRTICIKVNSEGKKVKQYNMYRLTSKNVKALVKISLATKEVVETVLNNDKY
jgi:hypothetical protein